MKKTICDKQGYWRNRESEKYGTQDLIAVIGHYRDSRTRSLTNEECDATIARLRAADKLCEVAKEARFIISIYCKEHIDEYDKAIADYEGKE